MFSDKTGFALWYQRLEKAKYKWPPKEKKSGTYTHSVRV
ncbi:TPA: IS66 family insertion sequence element accessory protein TnpB [Vibrio parahaemolyticus]|nr:IS66 family insertion sequence element accessory protein TnpB [Vibrio parahaemolyticus]